MANNTLKYILAIAIVLIIIGIIGTVVYYIYKNENTKPQDLLFPEVYGLNCGVGYANAVDSVTKAEQMCAEFDGHLASVEEVTDAAANGASWCVAGWTSDGIVGWPSDGSAPTTCGNAGFAQLGTNSGCANCYGIKPESTDTYDEWQPLSWNNQQWSEYS